MFQRTFEYKGYDGKTYKDTWYFNYTMAEFTELELGSIGGVAGELTRMSKSGDAKKIVEFFRNIILGAVGEKSPDGRRFIKNQEIRDAFYQTQAYSDLFTELVSDGDKFNLFIKGCAPDEMRKVIEEEENRIKKEEELAKTAEEPVM